MLRSVPLRALAALIARDHHLEIDARTVGVAREVRISPRTRRWPAVMAARTTPRIFLQVASSQS